MKNPFEGVGCALFDLDGTLVETRIGFGEMRSAVSALEARFGLECEAPSDGVPPRDVMQSVYLAEERISRRDTTQGEAFRREAFRLLEAIEARDCANPRRIAGAAELLALLRSKGVPVGIVTRNCRSVSLGLCEFAELEYDSLLTRDDVRRTKPDPDHLLRAIAEAGGARPAVIVGDHWLDVIGGRSAGLLTVGLLLGRKDEFYKPSPPDLVAETLADLLPLALSALAA